MQLKRWLMIPALSMCQVFAAIPINTVWETRASVGADTNGGGFVTGSSGTDFSQQNAAQVAYTDMILGLGGTSYTSILNPPGATLVGNIVQVISGTGCTAGFYEVTVVAAGVATLDRSAGSAASTCTSNLGGALATIAKAYGASVEQNTIYLKGSFSVAAKLSLAFDNTDGTNGASPFFFIGYSAARGDNGQATWTTATNSINLVDMVGHLGYVFQNITFSSTAGTPGNGFISTGANGGPLTFDNCIFTGFTNAINGDWNVNFAISALTLVNTEVKSSVSHGVVNTQSTLFYGSYIHDNGGDGFRVSGGNTGQQTQGVAISSVFYHNTGNGFNNPQGIAPSHYILLVNSAFVSNSAAGAVVQGGTGANIPQVLAVVNCVFENNALFGLNAGSSGSLNTQTLFLNRTNAYRNNTSGSRANWPAGIGDLAPSAEVFTSLGTNFALNNTAGAGALLKNAGYPGVVGIGTGSISVGPLQPSAGGGGAGQVGFPIVQ